MRERFGDAEVACLVHPRKLFVGMGREDELFDSYMTQKEYERLCKICGEDTPNWIDYTLFEGMHEFYRSDVPLEKFLDCLQ